MRLEGRWDPSPDGTGVSWGDRLVLRRVTLELLPKVPLQQGWIEDAVATTTTNPRCPVVLPVLPFAPSITKVASTHVPGTHWWSESAFPVMDVFLRSSWNQDPAHSTDASESTQFSLGQDVKHV